MGGGVRRSVRGRPPHRPGDPARQPDRHRVRRGGGDPCAERGRRTPDVRPSGRRRERSRPRGDQRRPGDGHRRRDGGARDRRPGGGQRRDGRSQGVPAGERAEPDQPQRSMHGHHREHGRGWAGRRTRRRPARAWLAPREHRRGRDPAAPDGARHEDRHGLRQARPEGALRPSRRGGRARPGTSGQAPARRARGAGSDVREARPDPVDPPRPAAARVHQGARDAAGRRPAAHRGAGRSRDGAGAGRAVGGRVRSHRATAARRRDDRGGPPRHARERREGRREGPAAGREGADRAGSGAARGLRREGRTPPRAQAGDRHGGGVLLPLGFASPGARLPAGGGQHAPHDGRDRVVLAPARAPGALRLLDVTPVGDARRRRRSDLERARGDAAQGGRAAAAGVLLQADHGRRLLPRRPASGEPDVAARGGAPVLPRPRDGRRGQRRDARADDAAADGVLAGGHGLPHRHLADAVRVRSTGATWTSTRSARRSARSWRRTGRRR